MWDTIPLEVSCHLTNLGLGLAMVTGFKHCLSRSGPGDILIAMDADIANAPALMPSMVRRIRSGSDVVIASRYAAGGCELGCSSATRIVRRGASKLLRVAFGLPGVTDYTSIYRAYSTEILKRGFDAYPEGLIRETGHAASAELLVKLAALGANITECPLVVRYDSGSGTGNQYGADTGRYLRLATYARPKPPAQMVFSEVGRLCGSRPDDADDSR